MGSHAVLSPSGAHKWLNCIPSARLEEQFENKESEVAKEGTAAHDLCEYKIRRALNEEAERPVSKFQDEAMESHSEDYTNFVLKEFEGFKKSCKDPILLLEEELDFLAYVPEGFGRADCLIIGEGKAQVIDFKYGMGVLLGAEENPQIMLYGLGALEAYDHLYDIKEITMTIFQPRRDNISSWTITSEELRKWAEDLVKPKAELAFKGEGDFKVGQWCSFCRAGSICRERAREKLDLAKEEFKLPPILQDEEIEEILRKLPDLNKWAEDILAYATDAAVKRRRQWRGFKVVEGRSNRKYSNENKVAKAATLAGYEDIYKKSLRSISEMEKLMGKKRFKEVLGDLVYKPPGKLTLVPYTDKRREVVISSAKAEFKEEL